MSPISLRRLIGCLIVMLNMIYLPSLYAEVNNDPAAAAQLQGILASIHTMQANFTQTVYNSHGKILRENRGKVALAKPNLFRWEIESPIQQNLITDGKNLWVYDVDLKQVRYEDVGKHQNSSPAMLLSGSTKSLFRMFSVKKVDTNQFLLKAKYMDNPFQFITMQFEGNRLTQMQLNDRLGQQSILTFSDIEINKPIPRSAFSFSTPAGVDVIRKK